MKRLRYSILWKTTAVLLIALSVIGCLGGIFCMFIAYSYPSKEEVLTALEEEVFTAAGRQLIYEYVQEGRSLDQLDKNSRLTGKSIAYAVEKQYTAYSDQPEGTTEVLYQSKDYSATENDTDRDSLYSFVMEDYEIPSYMPQITSLIGIFTHNYYSSSIYNVRDGWSASAKYRYVVWGNSKPRHPEDRNPYGGMMGTVYEWVNLIYRIANVGLLITFLSVVVLVASLGYLLRAAGHRRRGPDTPEDAEDEIRLRLFDRIPYGILLTATGLVFTAVCALFVWLLTEAVAFMPDAMVLLSLTLCYLGLLLLLLLALCSTAVRLKAHRFWHYTLCGCLVRVIRRLAPAVIPRIKWILHPIYRLWHFLTAPFRWFSHQCQRLYAEARAHMPLVAKLIGALLVFDFIELVAVYAAYEYYYYDFGVMIFVAVCFEIVKAILLLVGGFQLIRLKAAGQRIAEGDFAHPIDTRGLFWEFKQHGENINRVGDGIRIAVNERMKSEHFRTELITNVSHDIKTPLTSIINYVDLMKKEEIDNPTVVEYMEVLDRQSARLKKLIEDLMEASKASSGSLNVILEDCDVSVMLTQAVGEFTEKAEQSGLTFVVSGTDKPLHIRADGRHLWRVFDNLFHNVCKYAMPGTRVYVEAELTSGNAVGDSDGNGFLSGVADRLGRKPDTVAAKRTRPEVAIRIKNISGQPLNITSEELLQRFVRGDESRSTEGSGLGLSIAQSLAELMDGSLSLEIDGDLFKVVLHFPAI